MVKVTLYITCYNYAQYVNKAIQSALNQHFDDYEILIFDDGSTDNSREIISKYSDEPIIRIFFQENQGLVKTSNNALREAKGKYIMRLDADDFLDENALLVMTSILDREKTIHLVYPDYYEIDDEDNTIGLVRRKKIQRDSKFYDLPAHGACTLIDVGALKELGGYNENVTRQDGYDLWIRFIQKFNPYNVNIPLFYYRKHIESITSNSKKLLEARRKIKEDFIEINKDEFNQKSLLIVPFRKENVVENMYFRKVGEKTLLNYIEDNLYGVNADIVIVSEDDEILNYFEKNGFIVIKRPDSLAKQGTLINNTLRFVLDKLDENYDFTGVYFPTSPLVCKKYINEAFHTIKIFQGDSVISVKEVSKVFYTHENFGLKPLLNKHELLKQERDNVYEGTGGINIYKTDILLRKKKPKKVAHIVLDELDSYDIDDKISFWLIKQIILNKKDLDLIENRKIKRGY